MWTPLAVIAAVACLGFLLVSLSTELFRSRKEISIDGFIQTGTRALEADGYEILNADNEAKYIGYVDTSTIQYREKAHFIARKNGHEYAVFVGIDVPSEDEVCRRYFPLFVILDVQGLIFLNLSDESIHHVDFSVFRSRRYRLRRLLYRGMWFTSGIVFAFAWLHRA